MIRIIDYLIEWWTLMKIPLEIPILKELSNYLNHEEFIYYQY